MMHAPNKYRVRTGVRRTDDSIGNNGAFFVPRGPGLHPLRVIASDGVLAPDEVKGWEHVSVSLPDRCPTWEEMCRVKDLFWDADPSHAKAKVPPGPNGPVGIVWIDISKEHYGLHGSPEPGKIGHTSSHGCVRLTNWDAARLAALVKKGTPVVFEQ